MNLEVIQIKDTEACLGDTLILECAVYGRPRDSTVWQGSAFSDKCEITLLHFRFENGTFRNCNNGDITGQSIRVEDNNTSSNDSLYISQLMVLVRQEMIEKDIQCIYDNGSVHMSIGNISLISSPCNYNMSTMMPEESNLPVVAICISVMITLLTLLFILLLLYGCRKKIRSKIFFSV